MMKLEGREWREFYFKDIFEIKKGFYNKKPPREIEGKIPFIGASDNNNGTTEFYTLENINKHSKTGNEKNAPLDKKIFAANSICVTNNGSVGYAYYQASKFTCSHDVNPLYLKNIFLSKYLAYFLINSIEKQKVCFQYSRKWRPQRMVKSKILLPTNKNNQPDYPFMESYSKSMFETKEEKYLRYVEKTLKSLVYKNIVPLQQKEWREFGIEEIGTIYSGKDIYESERISGDTPYISATAKNNGIGYYVDNDNKTLDSNCLSINRNGSVGYSFYHPYRALFSNDCRKIKLHHTSDNIGFFIANQITKQKNKYNYGYKMGTGRLKRQKILLPINDKDEPDYAYMEQYIQNMKYKKIKQYLVFKGVG